MKGPSPLVGYNTNVRHKGKLFHIQTEDSGLRHPHIITHLFADGGRIVASKKTGYAEHVGDEQVRVIVKQLMRDQHKAMFIALRDGIYDEADDGAEPTSPSEERPEDRSSGPIDVSSLDRAAAKYETPAEAPSAATPPSAQPGYYQSTRPVVDLGASGVIESRPPESIFGSDLLSEKSLDEVILSYLAEDLEEGTEE